MTKSSKLGCGWEEAGSMGSMVTLQVYTFRLETREASPVYLSKKNPSKKTAFSGCCYFLNRWHELGNWHTLQAHLAVHSWVSVVATSCLTLYSPATFTALSYSHESNCFKSRPSCLATFYLSYNTQLRCPLLQEASWT